MNKIIAVAVATIISGSAFAEFDVTHVNATSVAGAGVATSSETSAVGNGEAFDAQGASAGAFNDSFAGAAAHADTDPVGRFHLNGWNSTSSVTTGARSLGGSNTKVWGINGSDGSASASGSSVAGAGQVGEGKALAVAGTHYPDTFTIAGSKAEVGSLSLSANRDNGWAENGTLVEAGNGSQAGATHQVTWHPDHTDSTSAGAGSDGETLSGSSSLGYHALSVTGGYANQGGFALGVAGSDRRSTND